MSAVVVWCNSCKTAVWAYDEMRDGQDVRGLLNMMNMPCPKCGVTRNFDGWESRSITLEEIKDQIATKAHPVYDWWSALKAVFAMNCKDGKWEISPDCSWFRRPDSEMLSDEYPSDLTTDVSELIRERYNNNLNVRAAMEEMEKVHKDKEA